MLGRKPAEIGAAGTKDVEPAAPEFPAVSYAESVVVRFSARHNENLYLESSSHADITVEPTPEGVRVNIPAATQRQARFGRLYLPIVKGNFEITASYRLLSLPKPRQYFNNSIALVILGNNGPARLQRMHHAGPGEHSVALFNDDEGTDSLKISPAMETAGIFRLRRHGEYLKAEWASGTSAPFLLVGHVKSPASDVIPYLETMAKATNDPVQVLFTSVEIRADKVVGAEKKIETIVEEFKGGFDKSRFRIASDPASGVAQPTPDGLRTRLDGSSLQDMALDFVPAIEGDFDATLTFLDLSLASPTKQTANFLHLVASSNEDTMDLRCIRYVKQPQTWEAWSPKQRVTSSGEVKSNGGQLRMVRMDQYLLLFASEGETGNFRSIWVGPYGKQRANLRVMLSAHGTGDKISVTLKRLEIRLPAQ